MTIEKKKKVKIAKCWLSLCNIVINSFITILLSVSVFLSFITNCHTTACNIKFSAARETKQYNFTVGKIKAAKYKNSASPLKTIYKSQKLSQLVSKISKMVLFFSKFVSNKSTTFQTSTKMFFFNFDNWLAMCKCWIFIVYIWMFYVWTMDREK